MSKNKIYIITKNKYDGHCRTIGFIRDLGKNIYYDFFRMMFNLKLKKMALITLIMKMTQFGERAKVLVKKKLLILIY